MARRPKSPRPFVATAWLAIVCAALVMAGCSRGSPTAPTPVTTPITPPVPPVPLTVTNGYGPTTLATGTRSEVWAALQPEGQIVSSWSGAGLLTDTEEWHATIEAANSPISVTANLQSVSVVFQTRSYMAPTSVAKTARLFIPPNPRGVILMLHGTSGSSNFIEALETRYLALKAISKGYAVIAPEAEESKAGDLDGDGKNRWFVQLNAANVDLQALNALLTALYASGQLPAGLPQYALGMSNGGAMAVSLGAVGTSTVAATFPLLRFKAVVSYCAQGRLDAQAVTRTPTAWYLCANDNNDEVDNAQSVSASLALAARGIATVAALHPATPLFDERFARISGVSLTQSRALSAEFRANALLDANRFFVVSTTDLITRATAAPSAYPTLTALTQAQQREVISQISVMRAEHQMFSDWSSRTLRWFAQFP